MHQLADYVLAIRGVGVSMAPEHIKTIDLVPGEGEDVVAATLEGLRDSGLTAADFRSMVVFIAPEGPSAIVQYAALCGFAGRRIDAYADGTLLRFGRMERDAPVLPDAGRPEEHLMWAQVGGDPVDGLPTVRLGPDPLDEAVTPDVVSVIRYAIRLRMVPPRSPRDALSAFVRIAAMRRRSDDRFPFLSTGRESMPVGKDGEDQGIDLELLRRRAARYRKEQRAGRAGGPELVPPVPVPARNRRIAEANAHDVRAVMRLLGVSGGDEGVWPCPRSRNHPAGDRAPSLRVSGDNRVRCRHCDSEKIGAVRLVADALGLTPDEAAAVVLGSP